MSESGGLRRAGGLAGHWPGWLPFATAALALTGCGKAGETPAAAAALAPAPIDEAICGACGMVVREQPVPRGQLAYRDGTRAFACSIHDLALLTATPSPHGKPAAVWVERQDAVADALAVTTTTAPWSPAEGAVYVRGIQRPAVMGKPALVFGDRGAADAALGRPPLQGQPGLTVRGWAEIIAETTAETR